MTDVQSMKVVDVPTYHRCTINEGSRRTYLPMTDDVSEPERYEMWKKVVKNVEKVINGDLGATLIDHLSTKITMLTA